MSNSQQEIYIFSFDVSKLPSQQKKFKFGRSKNPFQRQKPYQTLLKRGSIVGRFETENPILAEYMIKKHFRSKKNKLQCKLEGEVVDNISLEDMVKNVKLVLRRLGRKEKNAADRAGKRRRISPEKQVEKNNNKVKTENPYSRFYTHQRAIALPPSPPSPPSSPVTDEKKPLVTALCTPDSTPSSTPPWSSPPYSQSDESSSEYLVANRTRSKLSFGHLNFSSCLIC